MLALMPLGGFDALRNFQELLVPCAAKPGARGGNSGSCINTKNQHVRRCGGQLHRLIGHTPHRKRAYTHDLTKQQSRHIPQHRHSRVGGNPQGGRVTRVNKPTQPNPLSLDGRGIKGEGEQDDTNHIPLSLDGRGPKPVPVPDTGSRG